jgi:hypothetical protein
MAASASTGGGAGSGFAAGSTFFDDIIATAIAPPAIATRPSAIHTPARPPFTGFATTCAAEPLAVVG